MTQLAGLTIDDEQTRLIALGQGLAGDELGRQNVVVLAQIVHLGNVA
jgi:hypothetical protein